MAAAFSVEKTFSAAMAAKSDIDLYSDMVFQYFKRVSMGVCNLGLERLTHAQSFLLKETLLSEKEEEKAADILVESTRVSGKTTGLALVIAGTMDKNFQNGKKTTINVVCPHPKHFSTKFPFLGELAVQVEANLDIGLPAKFTSIVGKKKEKGEEKILVVDDLDTLCLVHGQEVIMDILFEHASLGYQIIAATVFGNINKSLSFEFHHHFKNKKGQDVLENCLVEKLDGHHAYKYIELVEDYIQLEPFCTFPGVILVKNFSQLRLVRNYLKKKDYAVAVLDKVDDDKEDGDDIHHPRVHWWIATVEMFALAEDFGNIQSVIFLDFSKDLHPDYFLLACSKARRPFGPCNLAFFVTKTNKEFLVKNKFDGILDGSKKGLFTF